ERLENANDYVAYLRGVRHLESITLAQSTLTNHGLYDLCLDHPDLRELDIGKTEITWRAVESIEKLQRLESLRIVSPRRTHEIESDGSDPERGAFARIAAMTSLKRVESIGLPVSNEDLKALARNSNLEWLAIGHLDFRGDADKIHRLV